MLCRSNATARSNPVQKMLSGGESRIRFSTCLTDGLAASAPAAIGSLGHSQSATDTHEQLSSTHASRYVDVEQHSMVLTTDGGGEPGGDAGQGDAATADASF